jgi:hypothetical protein
MDWKVKNVGWDDFGKTVLFLAAVAHYGKYFQSLKQSHAIVRSILDYELFCRWKVALGSGVKKREWKYRY